MEDVSTLLDKRRSHHFWIDDAVIDNFLPEIGVYGLAVYTYLSRRAKRSKTFPGIRRIAKDLGIGTSTVQKTLLHLKSKQLVDITQRRDDAGDAASNLYTLKDLSHLWGVPPGDTPVSTQNTPVPPGDTQVYRLEIHGVPPGDTEVFPLKDSQLKEIIKEGNPSISPHGETSRKRKTAKLVMPKSLAEQETLRTNLFDASFSAWLTRRYPDIDAEAQWEWFVNQCLMKEYAYADFRAAFQNSFGWGNSPAQHPNAHGSPSKVLRTQADFEAFRKKISAEEETRHDTE